jgi:hypothetical protein
MRFVAFEIFVDLIDESVQECAYSAGRIEDEDFV